MPKTIVHLIHGTWPHGFFAQHIKRLRRPESMWVHPESPFCRAMKEALPADVELKVFPWSGANSYLERHEAADRLARQLYDGYRQDDQTRHVLVAHSHGGNVALLAAKHPLMPPLAGIATLATPFLNVERRTTTERQDRLLRYVQTAAMLLTLATLLIGVFGQYGQLTMLSIARDWRTNVGSLREHLPFVVVVAVLLWVFAGIVQRANALRRVIAETPLIGAPRTAAWLILRAPGDEAGLVLAVARLAHLALGVVWRPIRALLRLVAPALEHDWFIPALCVPLAGASSVLPSVGRMLFLGESWPVAWRHVVPERMPADSVFLQRLPYDVVRPIVDALAPYSAVALATLLVFGLLLFIAGVLLAPFGWELVVMGVAFEVTAEPTPLADIYPVLMLPSPAANLRHAVYESEQARQSLAQWIAAVARSEEVPLRIWKIHGAPS